MNSTAQSLLTGVIVFVAILLSTYWKNQEIVENTCGYEQTGEVRDGRIFCETDDGTLEQVVW